MYTSTMADSNYYILDNVVFRKFVPKVIIEFQIIEKEMMLEMHFLQTSRCL